MTFKECNVHKARKTADRLVLDHLPGNVDLLDLCESVVRRLEGGQPIVDYAKGTFFNVVSATNVKRGLLVTAETAAMGDVTVVRDVRTGAESYTLARDDAAIVELRCLVKVPVGSTAGFVCSEIGNNRSIGTQITRAIHGEWMSMATGLTLQFQTVTRPADWLRLAELEKVTATVRGHQADIADRGKPETIGDMQYRLVPPKNTRFLSRRLKDRLLSSKVSRAVALGLGDVEPDEVALTLTEDGSTKTVVIGHEKTPAVRYVLSQPNEDPLTDKQFISRCDAYIRDLLSAHDQAS